MTDPAKRRRTVARGQARAAVFLLRRAPEGPFPLGVAFVIS
jgi:hypothetical protein